MRTGKDLQRLLLVLLVLVGLIAGCSDSDTSCDGDCADGDVDGDSDSDGDTPDGDEPDGDTTDGDVPDGDEPDGDVPDGDVPDGDVPDGDTPDGDEADTVAPVFKSVRASIAGEFARVADLLAGDASHVLPVPSETTFTVWAQDDVSDEETIVVTVVDAASGEAIEGQQKSYESGLWHVVLTLSAGMSLKVTIADEAGNSLTGDYALTIPNKIDAVVKSWEKRFYDTNQSVTHRWPAEYNADGSFSEERQDENVEVAGTYSEDDDGLFVWTERTRAATTTRDNLDSDPDTIELQIVGAYYVGNIYFCQRPFEKQDAGAKAASDELLGTWTSAWQVFEENAGGQLELVYSVELALTFTADNRYEQTETTSYPDAKAADVKVFAGNWQFDLNQSYVENYGNYLVRTIDSIDGSPVTESDPEAELFVIKAGQLLISPFIYTGGI